MHMNFAAVGLVPLFASLAFAGCPQKCQNPVTSCKNTTVVKPSCCFEFPGGQILQAQFWDTDPASGPKDHWTIDGTFPDHCDGSFTTYCAAGRQIQNATNILQSFNQTALLAYMRKYWHDYQGDDNGLWSSSWNSHGTCINTIDPKCYKNFQPHEDVIDYYTRTVGLFKTLDTFKFLAMAGILPDASRAYSSGHIHAALKAPRGVNAVLVCNSNGQLSGVFYAFNIAGNFATGNFTPAEPNGENSACPKMITYLPKNESTKFPISKVSSSALPTATFNSKCRKGANFPGK